MTTYSGVMVTWPQSWCKKSNDDVWDCLQRQLPRSIHKLWINGVIRGFCWSIPYRTTISNSMWYCAMGAYNDTSVNLMFLLLSFLYIILWLLHFHWSIDAEAYVYTRETSRVCLFNIETRVFCLHVVTQLYRHKAKETVPSVERWGVSLSTGLATNPKYMQSCRTRQTRYLFAITD